jgi:hypothetical protein
LKKKEKILLNRTPTCEKLFNVPTMLEFIVTNAQQKVYFVLELVFIMFEILEN